MRFSGQVVLKPRLVLCTRASRGRILCTVSSVGGRCSDLTRVQGEGGGVQSILHSSLSSGIEEMINQLHPGQGNSSVLH